MIFSIVWKRAVVALDSFFSSSFSSGILSRLVFYIVFVSSMSVLSLLFEIPLWIFNRCHIDFVHNLRYIFFFFIHSVSVCVSVCLFIYTHFFPFLFLKYVYSFYRPHLRYVPLIFVFCSGLISLLLCCVVLFISLCVFASILSISWIGCCCFDFFSSLTLSLSVYSDEYFLQLSVIWKRIILVKQDAIVGNFFFWWLSVRFGVSCCWWLGVAFAIAISMWFLWLQQTLFHVYYICVPHHIPIPPSTK